MTVPATPSVDLAIARWAKRTLTYGAMVVAVLSAGLLFLFQTANKVALAPYGLDSAGFSGSVAETIAGGLGSLLVLVLLILLLYFPLGWLTAKIIRAISRLYISWRGTPAWLTSLESWIGSDPAKRTGRAIGVGAAASIAFFPFLLLWMGSSIGLWRVSQAEWLVSANNCASGCYSYKQDGRPAPVIGRPIAANCRRSHS